MRCRLESSTTLKIEKKPNPSEIRQLWLGGFSQQSSNHWISKSLFSQPHSVLGVKGCVVTGFVKAFYMSWVIWDFWKGLWKALPFKPHSETNTYELCDAKIYLQPVFHLDLWKHFVGVLKAISDFWKGLWRAWNSPLQTFHLVCVLFIDFGIFIPNLALILFSQDLSISNHLQVWKAR